MFKIMGGIVAEESVYLAGEKFQKENPNSKIRFMPDCHGSGDCIVGTTMTITDKVNPSHIGVDIGCGVLSVLFDKQDIDFEALDNFIKENIPSGQSINEIRKYPQVEWIDEICHRLNIDPDRAYRSLGSLGGGNHFIEIGESRKGYCLTIHTGSRGFGADVARHYIKLSNSKDRYNDELRELIANTEPKLRESVIKEFKESKSNDIGYLTGDLMSQYLEDQFKCVRYSHINRQIIAKQILEFLGVSDNVIVVESIHNYIDSHDMVLRKGAISAHMNEYVVIPLNMRDGVVLGSGYGLSDWNFSAPHGAGRNYSRTEARKHLSLEEFKMEMNGIYSSCIDEARLDESPMAYKNSQMILDALDESIIVLSHFKTIYNFKGE